MAKGQKTFRITDKGQEMLRALAERIGVTETAVVEMAIREKHEREFNAADGGIYLATRTARPNHVGVTTEG